MLGVALALLLVAAPEMIPPDDGDLLGRSAPDVALTKADGKAVKVSDLKGRPVVLSFWATWCAPCRKELPALSALAATRPDVAFFAVNVDKDRAAAEKLARDLKLTVPLVFDPDAAVMARFDVVVMPTLFVIDANGTVKVRSTGFNSEEGLAALAAALGPKK